MLQSVITFFFIFAVLVVLYAYYASVDDDVIEILSLECTLAVPV